MQQECGRQLLGIGPTQARGVQDEYSVQDEYVCSDACTSVDACLGSLRPERQMSEAYQFVRFVMLEWQRL